MARPYIRDSKTGQMRGQRKVLLNADQIKIIIRALRDGLRRDDIAALAGVTVDVLEKRLRDQLKHIKRRGAGVGGGRRPGREPDPTEAQIWGELTAKIRAGWDDQQREQAAYGAFQRPERRR